MIVSLFIGMRPLVANMLFNTANLAATKTLFGENDDSQMLSLHVNALAQIWMPDDRRSDTIVIASLRAVDSCTREETNDALIEDTVGSRQAWQAWHGRCLWLRGEREKAIEIWHQAKVEPFWERLIILAQGQHDLNRALNGYDLWLAMNPQSVDAWLGMGKLHERMENWPNAESAYEQAIRVAPDSALAHQSIAFFRWRRGWNDERTEEELTTAIRLAHITPPQYRRGIDLPWLYTNLALRYVQTGRPFLAEKYARHAIVLAPTLAYPHQFLGEALRMQGDYHGAIAEFEQALDLGSNNVWIRFNLAVTYINQGDFEQAKREIDQLATVESQFEGLPALRDALSELEIRNKEAD